MKTIAVLFVFILPLLCSGQVYKGTEISGPGYHENIYTLKWGSQGRVTGIITPLKYAKGKNYVFEGNNSKPGILEFVVKDNDGKVIVTGTLNKSIDNYIRWDGEVPMIDPRTGEKKDWYFSLKRPKDHSLDKIDLMHGYYGDGPININTIRADCLNRDMPAAKELLENTLKSISTKAKVNISENKHIEGGVSFEINPIESVYTWEMVKLLRKNKLFLLVDTGEQEAGDDEGDTISVKSSMITENEKVSAKKIRALINYAIHKMQSDPAGELRQIIVKSLNVTDRSIHLVIEGAAKNLCRTNTRRREIVKVEYTIVLFESPEDKNTYDLMIANVAGKGADPGLFNNDRDLPDGWFTRELDRREHLMASGVFCNELAKAVNGKALLDLNSPAASN